MVFFARKLYPPDHFKLSRELGLANRGLCPMAVAPKLIQQTNKKRGEITYQLCRGPCNRSYHQPGWNQIPQSGGDPPQRRAERRTAGAQTRERAPSLRMSRRNGGRLQESAQQVDLDSAAVRLYRCPRTDRTSAVLSRLHRAAVSRRRRSARFSRGKNAHSNGGGEEPHLQPVGLQAGCFCRYTTQCNAWMSSAVMHTVGLPPPLQRDFFFFACWILKFLQIF